MTLTLSDFLQLDLPAMLSGTLAAMVCGLLGNFLILRRQALVGDALSHAILPGLVIAFILAGSQAVFPMVAGAFVAALIAVLGIEVFRRLGKVEIGAAMGVVFTSFFAFGVVLLEAGLGNVHLDAEHALYGQLEAVVWIGLTDWGGLLDGAVLANAPPRLMLLAGVAVVVALIVLAFFKELTITSFDRAHAGAMGLPVRTIDAGLMALVALAAVAAFQAVGSILVIAMFICPPATARMLTDRLSTQCWISLVVAAFSGIAGYLAAAWLPLMLGAGNALNAAGMIALVAGVVQTLAMVLAPRHGALPRYRARQRTQRGADQTVPRAS
jgi:manganese/zinc/iron transport system permease protein